MFAAISLFLVLAQGGAPASRPASILAQVESEYHKIAESLKSASVGVIVEFNDPVKLEFSGTLVDGLGHVAVPAAGVERADDISKIYIRMSDGRAYGAQLLAFYPKAPVAILEIVPGASPLPKAPAIAPRDNLQIGDTVGVVTNMLGLDGTSLFGYVSGLRRKLSKFGDVELIQTNVDSVNGSQGGAVGNRDGQIVGIMLGGSELVDWAQVTLYTFAGRAAEIDTNKEANKIDPRVGLASPAANINNLRPEKTGAEGTAQAQVVRTEMRALRVPGLSLVLPIENILDFLKTNKIQRPLAKASDAPVFGFVLNERIDNLTRSQLNLAGDEGLFVEEVLEGMPAKIAGILTNDIVVKIGGEIVGTNIQFRQKLLKLAGEHAISLEILRGGERKKINVVFSNR